MVCVCEERRRNQRVEMVMPISRHHVVSVKKSYQSSKQKQMRQNHQCEGGGCVWVGRCLGTFGGRPHGVTTPSRRLTTSTSTRRRRRDSTPNPAARTSDSHARASASAPRPASTAPPRTPDTRRPSGSCWRRRTWSCVAAGPAGA
jgi:hypothetical protein